MVDQLGLSDSFVFTGAVPPETVPAYLSAMDVFMIARPPMLLNELAVPLKLLEAMAMQLAVIGIDLPALREVIVDGVTGIIADADAASLARATSRLIEDATYPAHVGESCQRGGCGQVLVGSRGSSAAAHIREYLPKMKILMIAPVDPFPPNNGGLVRIVELFRGLSRYHDVVLVYPNGRGATGSSKAYVHGGSTIAVPSVSSRPRRLSALISSWPYHAKLYYSQELDLAVSRLLNSEDFSLCYCHFVYSLPYVQASIVPVVLDQQNVDREYWLQRCSPI